MQKEQAQLEEEGAAIMQSSGEGWWRRRRRRRRSQEKGREARGSQLALPLSFSLSLSLTLSLRSKPGRRAGWRGAARPASHRHHHHHHTHAQINHFSTTISLLSPPFSCWGAGWGHDTDGGVGPGCCRPLCLPGHGWLRRFYLVFMNETRLAVIE